MPKWTMIAAAVIAAVALAGCNREQGTAPVADAAATGEAADAIRAEEAQWNRDYAARNAEAILTHYAADGTLAGPGTAPLSGSQAIGALVRSMVADPAFRLEFAHDRLEVASSGDLGYTRGHFALTTTDPRARAPVTMRGTYLTVWRKQADGRWQAVEDMVTPGPPTR
jgi:uncharacterized protein (TIGR02246 family)